MQYSMEYTEFDDAGNVACRCLPRPVVFLLLRGCTHYLVVFCCRPSPTWAADQRGGSILDRRQHLLAAGKSQRQIARITDVDRKTIRSLVQRLAGTDSNSPGVATGSLVQIPPPRPPALSAISSSACEPYRDFITEQLRLRRNYTAIYQDLVDQVGFAASYNSVKRFAGTVVAKEPEQFDRIEFAPGEEVQVDYGEGAMTRVPGTDRYGASSAWSNATRGA